MAFAPPTTCAPSRPGGEEHRGDDVGDVGVEPEARGLRGADQVLACVEFRDRFGRGVGVLRRPARDSNVGGDAPAAPLDGVDGGGLLSEQRLPERATSEAAVSASTTTPQTARWRWWPCSSPSRPWCRSGIAGTPSCRRRTASRRGVRRGSSSLRGLLQRREVVAGPRDERPPRQRRRRGTPARGSSRT